MSVQTKMVESHPLSGLSKADLEMFLAQALSELTGSSATVQVSSMELGSSRNACLQLYVEFPTPLLDDGDTPF